jgi:hypothetical protein
MIKFSAEEKAVISSIKRHAEFKTVFRRGIRTYPDVTDAFAWIKDRMPADIEMTDELLIKLVQDVNTKINV